MAKATKKTGDSKPQAPKPNSEAPIEKGKDNLPKQPESDLEKQLSGEVIPQVPGPDDKANLSPANNGQPEYTDEQLGSEEQIPLEELKDIPVESGQMEEFKGEPDSMIPETGENNKPPLELDDTAKEEILAKQEQDDIKREEIRSATEIYTNKKNEWKLVAKTYNNQLDWEHTTMAMAIGSRGVLVHIKEAVGQKINATSVYIDNGKLIEENGKWILK